MHDQHGHRAVLDEAMAHAAEEQGADATPTPGADGDQIITVTLDSVQDDSGRVSFDKAGLHGEVSRNCRLRCIKDRTRVGLYGVGQRCAIRHSRSEAHAYAFIRVVEALPRGNEREARLLRSPDVDSLLERGCGMSRTVYSHNDPVKHYVVLLISSDGKYRCAQAATAGDRRGLVGPELAVR
jgi:hypothetical protein